MILAKPNPSNLFSCLGTVVQLQLRGLSLLLLIINNYLLILFPAAFPEGLLLTRLTHLKREARVCTAAPAVYLSFFFFF